MGAGELHSKMQEGREPAERLECLGGGVGDNVWLLRPLCGVRCYGLNAGAPIKPVNWS